MTNEEIERAIAKGRLPFTFFNYFLVAFFLLGVIILVVQYVNTDNQGPEFIGFGIFFCIVITASIVFSKLLTPLKITSAPDRKVRVLDQIISDFNGTDIKREPNCIRFQIGSGFFENIYNITVLYTEEGYYINSIFPNNRGSQMYGSNKNKVKEIIKRISQLESYKSI